MLIDAQLGSTRPNRVSDVLIPKEVEDLLGFGAQGTGFGGGFEVLVAFDAVGAAGTAAETEEPKKACGPGKEHGHPEDDVDGEAPGAGGVVFRKHVVEGPDECGVQDGGR